MLRIREMSDIHLEFSNYIITNDDNIDVLILAGDILLAGILHDYPEDSIPKWEEVEALGERQQIAVRFRNFIRQCSEQFPDTIMIAGNHEAYHSRFFAGMDYIREEVSKYPNVTFLENECVTIGDVKFIGCTLWTDLNKGDPLTEYMVRNGMSDYSLIKNDHVGFRRLLPMDTMIRHAKSLEYLKSEVAEYPNDKVVVITHHAPSALSIDVRFKDDKEMNGAYFSSLDEWIMDNPQIKYYFHGHTHSAKDYMIGTTRVICNPRGYQSDRHNEITGFDELMTVVM